MAAWRPPSLAARPARAQRSPWPTHSEAMAELVIPTDTMAAPRWCPWTQSSQSAATSAPALALKGAKARETARLTRPAIPAARAARRQLMGRRSRRPATLYSTPEPLAVRAAMGATEGRQARAGRRPSTLVRRRPAARPPQRRSHREELGPATLTTWVGMAAGRTQRRPAAAPTLPRARRRRAATAGPHLPEAPGEPPPPPGPVPQPAMRREVRV